MGGGGGGYPGENVNFGGQMLKAKYKKNKNKQVLTSWLRGSETLNKLVKGWGEALSPYPSPVASTAAIHSLLQS